MDLIPSAIVESLIAALPEELHSPVRLGLQQLEASALEVALAAWRAEVDGVAFADAVRDEQRFGALSRFHFGWLDALQFELPPEAADQVRAGIRMVAGASGIESVRREIFGAAAVSGGAQGAFLRFLLVEALFANLTLAVRHDDGSLEASGCLRAAEARAQEVLAQSLEDARLREADVRPLDVMFVDLLIRLHIDWAHVSPTLARATIDFRERFDVLTEASRRARLAGAQDAAIIRTLFAREHDGQSVGSQRLVDRHPLLYSNAACVDQRRSRLRREWERGVIPRARKTRLVDILFEDSRETHHVQQ